jgi:hypothetical protein
VIDYFSLIDTASYRVVKLETTDNSLIGEVSKVEVVNDRIIVLDERDSESVFMFDGQGNFIRQIGRKGRGPGEYTNAVNFVVDYDNSHIIVSDEGGRKQLFYDFDGRFIKEYKMRYHPMAYIGGKFFFISNPLNTPERYEVVEVDTLNHIVGGGGYYSREKMTEKIDGYYMPSFYFYQTQNGFYFIPLFTDELYLLTGDGIELKHRFGFGKRALHYDTAERFLVENKFGNITNFAITDDLNYYFTVRYGTESTFFVYGNLKSGKVEATSSGELTFINNPSVIPKTLMAMDIIGAYKNEFISGFYSAHLVKDWFPDATEEDNPYLIFFKIKNLN